MDESFYGNLFTKQTYTKSPKQHESKQGNVKVSLRRVFESVFRYAHNFKRKEKASVKSSTRLECIQKISFYKRRENEKT